MSARIRALQERKANLMAASRSIMDAASAANQDLTAEQQSALDANRTSITGLNAQIESEQAFALEEAGMAASAAVAAPAAAAQVVTQPRSVVTVTENRAADPRGGFASFGHYLQAVRGGALAQRGMGAVDQRLTIEAAVPGTAANEMSGQDGGYLVPVQFSQEIFSLTLDEDALLPLTDNTQISGNAMAFPKDETTPWGTDGIRAFWQGELSQLQLTKPVFGVENLRLKKLAALTAVSDELLADSTALASYLPKKMAQSIQWKTNEAILYGTGGPQPLGLFNGAGAVVVAKDSGQANQTVSALNFANMMSRLTPGSLKRSVWLMNNDALPALFTLTLGNYPIYLPLGTGGSITGSPYGMLLGRPVMVSQHAPSFGSAGDISLVDLSWYQAITKAEGVTTATSMHLYFDADATAFRTTFRMDGQPKITKPITPAKGSNTLSPFVSLAKRAP